MKPVSIGKILITLVCLMTAVDSYAFDWNETHIFNDKWLPLNVTCLLKWLIFIPIIFPLCIAFGIINGVRNMTERIIERTFHETAVS